MSVTEAQRHELYESFKEHHGVAVAEIFMNLQTPIDISALATRTDLSELRRDMATKTDLAELRRDMATKTDLAELNADLRRDMATKTDLAELKADMLRTVGTWWIAGQSVVVGLITAFGIFG